MASTALETILHNLRRTLLRQDLAEFTDAELLESFIARRDEAAFEALLCRHGPMVLGVCRRVLCNEASAEDAFQATFLVLIRKASCIRPRAMVGNWLYGVAQSTALKARAMSTKRLAKEREAAAQIRPADSKETWNRFHALLDQELKSLPQIYRSAIVLCDLEGNSLKEAGRQLGCPPATIGTRLARGRHMLARRLSRRGLSLSTGVVAAAMADTLLAATVPPMLMNSTVHAAKMYAAGPAAAGAISAKVAALTEGVLKTMLLTKLKIMAMFFLAAGLLTAGAGWTIRAATASKGPESPAFPEMASRGAGEEQTLENKPRGAGQAGHAPADAGVHGSGKLKTKEFELADFASVETSRTFQVEITRSDSFRVTVTTDDNLLPHIQAIKDGAALRLSIDPNLSFWATSLKATIAMPSLEGLRTTSGSRVTLKGFKSDKPFKSYVAFSSTLDGEIEAGNMNLEAAGGARVTLKGSARELKVLASHASRLSLADFTADRADVTLRDGSTMALRVKEKLEYDLNRACRLEYLGNPATARGKAADGSSAVAVTIATQMDKAPAMRGVSHQGHHGSKSATAAKTEGRDAAALRVGSKVPDFAMKDLHGASVKFSALQKEAKGTNKGAIVLSFWCSTCPSCRRVEHQLDQLARDYQDTALVFAVDANAGEMAESVGAVARKTGLTLPIFLNPDGSLADLFGTEVTTTTVVIDTAGVLRYCGRFNDGGGHAYAEDALKAVLAGKEVAVKSTRHDGCGIIRQ